MREKRVIPPPMRTGNYVNLFSGSNKLPVGTERMDRNGYIRVKVSDKALPRRSDQTWINWKLRAVVVWEMHNGVLPDGYRVVHLDRSRDNDEIDNLYAISRGTVARMISRKWWTDNPTNNLAAIRCCELE